RANAELFRELENSLVGGVVFRKTIDALCGDFYSRRRGELTSLCDPLVAGRRRQVATGRQLDIANAHPLQMPQHLWQSVFAQRNRLYPNRKSAPLVVVGSEHPRCRTLL